MTLLSRRQILGRAASASALLAISRATRADNYPTRPIRLVIPYTAGAAGDQIGRPWADKMTSLLGPTFVENIGGAGGAAGGAGAAHRPPPRYSPPLGHRR